MLIPDHIRPEESIYYNGAKVLGEMQTAVSLPISELYVRVRSTLDISFANFLLCLDWLYLINIVEVKEGSVVLCS